MEKQDLGICYECSTKDMDSSKKVVYHCDVCNKWFCELHLKPKLPYFVDWETMFDVQGNPDVKALFYSEYRRQDGHPDFVYLRKTVEALELDIEERNKLIQQAIDRMVEANWKRGNETPKEYANEVERGKTETTENKYGYRFIVPKDVYSNPEYREYLNYAKTMKSVKGIVDEYYRKYGKTKSLVATLKKKHWWQ